MPKNRHLLLVKNVIVMGFAVAFSYYKMERGKGQMQVNISRIMWIRWLKWQRSKSWKRKYFFSTQKHTEAYRRKRIYLYIKHFYRIKQECI